jgi:hypothetical protein
MELLKEILSKEFNEKEVAKLLPDLTEMLNSKCYLALKEIKEILDDTTLNDEECFYKIEKIVCVFEAIGSNGGSRHDL